MLEDFHSRCDKKEKTVSLFQIKDGDCIGGYTSQCWESCVYPGDYKVDRRAFLFNLTRSREPFNGKDNCRSWANEPGYNIPEVDGKNQLTNQGDNWFTISELEVWLLEEE